MPLKPIGQLIHADDNGQLPRIGRPPDPSWRPILAEILRPLQDTGRSFAIITRGSVARGASVPEAADLDLVLIHSGCADWAKECNSALMPELKIELSCIPLNEFYVQDRWIWMRFMLAHNGYTVHGPDYLSDLPEPRLGPQCFAHLRNADHWLSAWPRYWEEDKDYRAICEWLMKRIVRSLFESQIMRVKAFTRDIYPCAEVAAQAWPEHSVTIWRAAELAVDPVEDKSELMRVVEPLSDLLMALQAKARST